jgi:hypothetical protein
LTLPLWAAANDHPLEDGQPQQGHRPLPEQHQDGHPPPDVADDRQPDEGHPGHRLVGDRVGDLAEVRDQAT